MSSTNNDTPLHVALFIPSLGGGGAERVFNQLANGLAERVRRVDLLVAKSGGHYEAMLSPKVRLVDLGARRTITSVKGLRDYMRRERPDVMLSTLSDANCALLLAQLFTPKAPPIVIRETVVVTIDLRSLGLKGRALAWLARVLYPRARAVISLSKGVADDLAASIPGMQPITVVYNPAPSAQELSLGGYASAEFHQAKARGPVFVAAGRLAEQKDYPTLFRAFARVRASRPASLWILGEGEDRPALVALAQSLGVANDIHMPGFVRDPYPYLRGADVFVMSSKYEGGPSAMLQAMAVGCKIVSTDCPSGPAEFLEHGAQGILVPVGDDERFADAMLRALDEPLQRESRAKSMQRFDPERFVDTVLGILRSAVTPRLPATA